MLYILYSIFILALPMVSKDEYQNKVDITISRNMLSLNHWSGRGGRMERVLGDTTGMAGGISGMS